MRQLLLAALATLTLTMPLAAQDVSFPTLDFPAPGTFCGPLKLCPAEVTRGTGG